MALSLTQLAREPQLIKITLSDPAIVEKYGDELEFSVLDRQPIDQFIKMATANEQNYGELIRLIKDLVLDEKGKPILTGEQVLPNDIMLAVITEVVAKLGK